MSPRMATGPHGPFLPPHGRDSLSENRWKPSSEAMIPVGLALFCFLYYLVFLFHYGEMFYKGSDIVANTAYGMTMFSEVHRAGWTVPKPAHMLLFGSVYWLTRDLWFVHLTLIAATSLTVWAGCRLVQRHGAGSLGCLAFCLFMMTLPRTFGTTLSGGPGCVNVMFLFLAVVCLERMDQRRDQVLAVLFLSFASLTRPDSWPCTYLLVFLVIAFRLRGGRGTGLRRADLLFLIPLAMPLLWVFLDRAVFGDPLYSVKIARAFVEETLKKKSGSGGPEPNVVLFFLPKLKTVLLDLFSLPEGPSLRAGLVGLLGAAGAVTMFRRNRVNLLLVGCLLFGTLLFYFVYALRGTLFRSDYVYTLFACAILVTSIGLASLCGLAGRALPPAGRYLPVAVAVSVLLYLTLEPYQEKVIGERLPVLEERAALSVQADAAVDALVEDVKRSGVAPVVLTTKWISTSRVAMRLGTGKDLFLVERLVSRARLGKGLRLPTLEGRTVYICFLNTARRDVALFLKSIIAGANRKEILHSEGGLAVVKCTYQKSGSSRRQGPPPVGQ